MPLPNHRSIPDGIADHLAPAVRQGMTGRVQLSHPDTQTRVRDETTGRTVFGPAPPYYDGPARIQARGGGPPTGTGSERQVGTGGYLVAVPHTVTEARPGDVVRVVDGGDEPAATGLLLTVDEVPTASVVLQRNLTCSRHVGVRPSS